MGVVRQESPTLIDVMMERTMMILSTTTATKVETEDIMRGNRLLLINRGRPGAAPQEAVPLGS